MYIPVCVGHAATKVKDLERDKPLSQCVTLSSDVVGTVDTLNLGVNQSQSQFRATALLIGLAT